MGGRASVPLDFTTGTPPQPLRPRSRRASLQGLLPEHAACKHVVVLVLGDVGRSPRMQYHAMSLASHGVWVTLLGYTGERCIGAVENSPRIDMRRFEPPLSGAWGKRLRRQAYLLFAVAKAVALLGRVMYELMLVPGWGHGGESGGSGGSGSGGAPLKPDVILVQNPPSLPGLACVYLACLLRRCHMVLDWHNLGFTMFGHGPQHPLVWITRKAEGFFGRRATVNLTVSHAMRTWIKDNFDVPEAYIVYDQPPDFFRSPTLPERHELFTRLAKTDADFAAAVKALSVVSSRRGEGGRPAAAAAAGAGAGAGARSGSGSGSSSNGNGSGDWSRNYNDRREHGNSSGEEEDGSGGGTARSQPKQARRGGSEGGSGSGNGGGGFRGRDRERPGETMPTSDTDHGLLAAGGGGAEPETREEEDEGADAEGRGRKGVDRQDRTLFTTRSAEGICELRRDRPALLVSSTSWTPDEDFSILLEALRRFDARTASGASPTLPLVMVVVTGKGPDKAKYVRRMKEARMSRVAVCTAWLEPQDYPLLLGSADLGICLHTSTSGVDLPMKVVDMFGCGVPVCAVHFECLKELVQDGFNGCVFKDSTELALQLEALLDGFPRAGCELDGYRSNVQEVKRWKESWDEYAWPLFSRLGRRRRGSGSSSSGGGDRSWTSGSDGGGGSGGGSGGADGGRAGAGGRGKHGARCFDEPGGWSAGVLAESVFVPGAVLLILLVSVPWLSRSLERWAEGSAAFVDRWRRH